jgi:hypothetical protein
MSGKGLGSGSGSSRSHEKGSAGPSSRKRGGASADKEHKRLKRSKVTSFLILALYQLQRLQIQNFSDFKGNGTCRGLGQATDLSHAQYTSIYV